MSQYCDSAALEKNWCNWLLSSRVPALEEYRKMGLLWTKIVGEVRIEGQPLIIHGKTLPDPSHPVRSHCIALATPIFFDSNLGEVPEFGIAYVDGKPVEVPLSLVLSECTLLSEHWLHNLDGDLFDQQRIVIGLQQTGYIKEFPTKTSWHAMLHDVSNMCKGIAVKFKQKSDEERDELSHEALAQVIQKMASYKLVYTPGLAPVFNLLTTTIYRCMYSIMNKRTSQRNGTQKLLQEVSNGVVISANRSLRTHSNPH